jgi:hypothetical protein
MTQATVILIGLIIQGIQAALAAAPQAIEVAEKGKEFIASLFRAGLITKEVQDAVHGHVDSIAALAAAGVGPAHWTVEDDPE